MIQVTRSRDQKLIILTERSLKLAILTGNAIVIAINSLMEQVTPVTLMKSVTGTTTMRRYSVISELKSFLEIHPSKGLKYLTMVALPCTKSAKKVILFYNLYIKNFEQKIKLTL